jgi:hypothetical protein
MSEMDRVKDLWAYTPSPTAKNKKESKELEAIEIFKKLKVPTNPTEGAIVEARGIIESHEADVRSKSSAAISQKQHAEVMYARAVLANAKSPTATKKNKGGPIQKRPQMMHGGAYKGKKHAYTAGGSVHSMNMGRKK